MSDLTFVLNDAGSFDVVIDGTQVGKINFNKDLLFKLLQTEDDKNIVELIQVLSSYIAQCNILILEMDRLLLKIINLGNGCSDREATYMRDKIHRLLGKQ